MLFTIKFSLHQHTPVIHFQKDARDATLRATELKPKLDRFLTEKLSGTFDTCKHLLAGISSDEKRERDMEKRWKEDGYRALDYTVRVKTSEVKQNRILGSREDGFNRQRDTIPTFFANLGEDYEQSPKFKSTAKTELIFTSPHDELLELIPQHLDEFFWHHNFGTRQSKGWGSFTVASADCDFVRYEPQGFFQFSVPKKDDKSPFDTINDFYRLLRAGLNGVQEDRQGNITRRTHYCKPVIFEYASFAKNPRQLVLQWEKKTIKQNLLGTRNPTHAAQVSYHGLAATTDHPLTVSSTNEKDIKDLLGFSTVEAWKKYGATVQKTHLPNPGEDEIRRMKSPMFFKPIKSEDGNCYQIYFRFEPLPDEIRDAKIQFAVGRTTRNIHVFDPPPNFFEDMIRFAANDIPWSTFFQADPKANDPNKMEGQTLKNEIIRIFNEIKAKLP